ncbi:MAG TPA: hypothetical protein VK250_02590 [Nitrososphaeraceae archaeon]|nr:hypothetical protein [Nitrososphaeraceae archaeon]
MATICTISKTQFEKIYRFEHYTNVSERTPLVVGYDKQVPAEGVRGLHRNITWFLLFEKIP